MADVIQIEIKRKSLPLKPFVEGATAKIMLFTGVRFERMDFADENLLRNNGELDENSMRNRAV